MRVLVTGASGFVGNHVITELLWKGHSIVATSRDAEKASSFEWFDRVRYIPFNLQDAHAETDYFDFFQRPDLMIHLAWEGLPDFNADHHLSVNLPRHMLFLDNIIRNGLTDLTVTGTCLEYGLQEGCLNESMVCYPVTAYGAAKLKLLQYLLPLQQNGNLNLKWMRLFYMYGKGQHPKSLIPQLEAALEKKEHVFNMSGGEQVRDFLPIEKVAEYIVSVASQKEVTGIINCCSGDPVSVKDFVEEYLGKRKDLICLNLGYYPYPLYEPMAFWGDNTKLASITIQ